MEESSFLNNFLDRGARTKIARRFFPHCTKLWELTSTSRTRRFDLVLKQNFIQQKSRLPQRGRAGESRSRKLAVEEFENAFSFSLPPKGKWNVRKPSAVWKIYRTRFLIKARQLTQPLIFVDALGREHHGEPGDYLVESSDGSRRIAPRLIFEDVYVAMGPADERWPSPLESSMTVPSLKRRASPRPVASA